MIKKTMMMTKLDEISQKAEEILSKPYIRRLLPDETGGYVSSIQEFPGCIAEGDTADDAINNLNNAAASWVEAALSSGYEIRDPVSYMGYSGKIALRIPRGLHKQVAELAELEESSINQLLTTAISQYMGSKRVFREMSEAMLSEMRSVMSDGFISLSRQGTSTFLIAFSNVGKSPFGSGTTLEGHVTEKLFNLSRPLPLHNMSTLQS